MKRKKNKSDLTKREAQIVKMLADGKTVKEVADELSLSAKTVDTHKTNLMRKLDIHNRADLCRYAFKNNLATL